MWAQIRHRTISYLGEIRGFIPSLYPSLMFFSPQFYFSVSSSDLFHRRSSDGVSLQCAASRGTSGCAGPSAIFHSSYRGNLLLCGKTCADGVPVSGRKSGRTRRRDTASLRCGSSDGTRGSLRDTDSRRSVNMHLSNNV